MPGNIVIIDLGMGNLFSVKKKIDSLNVNCIISSSSEEIKKADKLILPGVGHFGKAMNKLISSDIFDPLIDSVMVNKKPILGICLGMQLMAQFSEEGNCKGLGWFDAQVVKFRIKDYNTYKIPHIGWNNININKKSRLMEGIAENDKFYFVHSYHMLSNNTSDVLNMTEYEYPFVSAIERDNIFGVQYHPEKSHDAGTRLLKNFVNL